MNPLYSLSDNLTNNLQNPTQSTDTFGVATAKSFFGLGRHTASPSRSNSFFEPSEQWQMENRSKGIDEVRDPLAIFTPHFKTVVREALSTGVISDMNAQEKEFFKNYVTWVDMDCDMRGEGFDLYRCVIPKFMLTTSESLLIAFDRWLITETNCMPQRGPSNPDMHTWVSCTAVCTMAEFQVSLPINGREGDQGNDPVPR